MGSGLPVVAAEPPINLEICANAALYYSPLDSTTGAKTILEALKPLTRKKLIEHGQIRLKNYDWSWNRCARHFVDSLVNSSH
jgi:hypothetical protein